MYLDSQDVLDWLGRDAEGIGYYLHALNLHFEGEGTRVELRRFGAVARRLRERPDHWSKTLRHDDWRYHLVGCVCVLLARPPEYFDDLAWRLEQGSFVAPQIGTTMGIVYPDRAVSFLNDLLDRFPDDPSRSKQITTARAVLARLGRPRKITSIHCDLDVLGRPSASIARNVVRNHWEFWSEHSGNPRYLASAP